MTGSVSAPAVHDVSISTPIQPNHAPSSSPALYFISLPSLSLNTQLTIEQLARMQLSLLIY
jgi:hypothetical protein